LISDEEKPISTTEFRKWNHPILVSVIVFALVFLGIIFAVNLASLEYERKFSSVVIQLNALSGKGIPNSGKK
jgi:hypothetical protein